MSDTMITLIGGPTVLIETGGFRLLTDPTFDPPGEYKLPHVTLKKTAAPALTIAQPSSSGPDPPPSKMPCRSDRGCRRADRG
jgi:L-ascorbate metabolism protein UlaG (beta-lactamase superfamily)